MDVSIKHARVTLVLLCFLAVALRLALYAVAPSVAHPDEVFQYLEPAHRLVHGTGMLAWEYGLGLRSWLLPGMLAGPLWLARLVGESPVITGWAVALLMTGVSLVPIASGYWWGLAGGGISAALIAGVLNGFWAGALMFTLHPLADTFGAALLVGGLYLASPGFPVSGRRLFLAGIVLGFAVCVRVQLAPAIPIAAIGICGKRWRDGYLPLLAGLAPPVVLLGLLDTITLGMPWQSVWLYAWINQAQGISAAFGADSWYTYGPMVRAFLGWSLPALILAAGLGARERPLLACVTIGIVVTMSVIPHKELRFLHPATALMLTLAGIGTARVLQGFLPARPPWLAGALGSLAWLVVSAGIAAREPMRGVWTQVTPMIQAARAVSADPAICGVAFYPATNWAATPGYTGLRPGIGIWMIERSGMAEWGRFNAILANDESDFSDRGFAGAGCWTGHGTTPEEAPFQPGASADFPLHRVCLWRANTGCAPGSAPSMQTPLPPELLPLAPSRSFLVR